MDFGNKLTARNMLYKDEKEEITEAEGKNTISTEKTNI